MGSADFDSLRFREPNGLRRLDWKVTSTEPDEVADSTPPAPEGAEARPPAPAEERPAEPTAKRLPEPVEERPPEPVVARPPEPVEERPHEPAEERPRGQRRWPWLVLLVLVLAAVLGAAVGVGVVLRGRSFGTPLPSETAARPTFVVATSPSPAPSGSPVPAATPSAIASSDEYTVEAGDTLRSIALQAYGDATLWPRIYDANRDAIGPDPDALSAGMRLRIPTP